MPDGNGEFRAVATGRDEGGRFLSKNAVQEAAVKLVQDYQKALGDVNAKIKESNAKYREQKQITNKLFKDFAKSFEKQQRDWTKAQKSRSKLLEKQFKEREKSLKAFEKLQSKTRRAEMQELKKQYRMQTREMRKQVNDYRKLAREKMKAARAGMRTGIGGGGFRGGIGFAGGLGIGAAATGAVYGAIRRARDLANQQLQAALSLGPGIVGRIRATGAEPTMATLRMLGAVAGTGPSAQFGMTDEMLSVLVNLKEQIKSLKEVGDEAIANVVESFGGQYDRMRDFFSVAASQGIDRALADFKTVGNYAAFNRLQNALQLQGMADQGTLDPLLQSSIQVAEKMADLQEEIDKLIMQLAKEFAPAIASAVEALTQIMYKIDLEKISLGKIAAYGIGAYLGLKGISSLLFGGGLVGQLGRGGLKQVPKGIGRGLASPYGLAALAGIAISATLDETGLNRLGNDSQRRAGRYGYGAVSWWLHSRDVTAAQEEMSMSKAQEFQRQADLATNELDRLRYQRSAVAMQIAAGDVSKGDEWQRLRDQIVKLKEEMGSLPEETKQAETSQSHLWETIKSGAKKAIDFVREANKRIQEQQAQARDERLRQQLLNIQQTKERAGLAGTETELARIRYEYAQMSVFGSVGAIPEMESLNQTIETEIEKLEKVLDNIDESTTQGIAEANQVRSQILRLRTEQKKNFIDLNQALIEGVVSQALGAGGTFEKIIIDQNRNLGQGLLHGMINPDVSPRVGRLRQPGETIKSPVYIQDLIPDAERRMFFDAQESAGRMNYQSVTPLPQAAPQPQETDTGEQNSGRSKIRSTTRNNKASSDTIASSFENSAKRIADTVQKELGALGPQVSEYMTGEHHSPHPRYGGQHLG